MNAKKCDRCHKFYDPYGSDEEFNTVALSLSRFDGIAEKRKSFDLCQDCMHELEDFLGFEKPEKVETPWQYFWRKIGDTNNDQDEERF